MTMTINEVVNVRIKELTKIGYTDFQHWLSDPNNVYIGRNMSFYVPGAVSSVWQNPYVVGKNKYTLDESLDKYREHILKSDLVNRLNELNGKTLGCWCKPNRCHGDVLKELIELRGSTDNDNNLGSTDNDNNLGSTDNDNLRSIIDDTV